MDHKSKGPSQTVLEYGTMLKAIISIWCHNLLHLRDGSIVNICQTGEGRRNSAIILSF